MNVFFDVQGTLVGEGGSPRPRVRETLETLIAADHGVYLWSSAGGGYARRAAEMLGIEDLVLGYSSKHAPTPVPVDFAVDDAPGVVGRLGGFTVPAFSGDPDDDEMEGVPVAIAAAGGASA